MLQAVEKRLRAEQDRRQKRNKLAQYKPYAKQAAFHAAGAEYRLRCFFAGNQLGKTFSGASEAAIHLTGLYPKWWTGRRFDKPIRMWVGSVNTKQMRESTQVVLLGDPTRPDEFGSGALPGDKILRSTKMRGVPDCYDSVVVQHVSGGQSVVSFKTYEEGRQAWQGASQDVIWFDEECPEPIFMEGITRTNATDGMVYMTFTPLLGVSSVVHSFLTDDTGLKHVTRMTIEDAEHISPQRRAEIIASYPPHEREARVKGLPAMGSGRIYPVTEEAIRVEAFPIPSHWAQIAGLDFGWDHPTAAVKLAHDRDADVIYVTHAYRRREATPVEHCAALRPWGRQWWAWPPDAYQRDKRSGGTLQMDYESHGLMMLKTHATHPDGGNGVEAGIMQILERMQSGRLKVFAHLTDWWDEFRMYHRKEGLIVKERDDLMDAMRYAVMMLRFAEPDFDRMEDEDWDRGEGGYGDDGRSDVGGY